MPDTAPDAARQRFLPISGTGDLVVITFLVNRRFKFDPASASNFDPFERRVLAVALASSELAGVAETWRARAV